MSLTAIAAGLSGISAIASIFGGRKAEKAADRQAEEEARLEKRVTEEKVRQLGIEAEQARGQTIATAAGSGVMANKGSPLAVLAEQAFEFERERQVTAEVGASRAATALESGRALGDRYRYQGQQNALSGLASMFGILGSRPPGN